MKLAHVLAGLLTALLAACGNKPPDCDALGEHVAEVSTRDEDPRFKTELYEKSRKSHAHLCQTGAYDAKQIACLQKVSARADVNRCLGLPDVDLPAAPAPDAAPTPPPKPTVEQAASAYARMLFAIADELDTAFMHGCAEGVDRIGGVFEERAERDNDAEMIAAIKADPDLRAGVSAALRDRSHPDIQRALEKLEAKAGDCKDAPAELQKRALGLIE